MTDTKKVIDLRDAHANDIDCGCYGPGGCKYAAALARLREVERRPAPQPPDAEAPDTKETP